MQYIRIALVFLCGVAMVGTMRRAGPATLSGAARPLIITQGGTYTGTYSTITIIATDGKPVIIDRARLTGPGDLITQRVPCDLTVCNTEGTTKPPGKFLVAWRFVNLDVRHNLVNGTGGILIRDDGNTGQSAHILFNRGVNISGATAPGTREKTSFIQFQKVHVPNLEIAWNHVSNEPGISAVEDNIALMLSGGTKDHPAVVHDNFVDGAFAYPAGTSFSGAGIMCFDPAGANNVTEAGYSAVFHNQVVGIEHQGLVVAGGHDIEVYANRIVNDGTTTRNTAIGCQVFNWAGKTPAEIFGRNVAIHDNFSYWTVGDSRQRSDWSITAPAVAAGNVSGTASDAGERKSWTAKCNNAGVCVGPLPERSAALAVWPSP